MKVEATQRKAAVGLFVLIAALLGCGDSGGNGDGGGTGPTDVLPERDTIEKLITEYLGETYASLDTIGYFQALRSTYQFHQLQEEEQREDIDYEAELRVARHMFTGWRNQTGIWVDDIAIDISITSVTEDPTGYDEKPSSETWFLVQAVVAMRVFAQNPDDPDGETTFKVDSTQDFIVAPDQDEPGLWVLARQFDGQSVDDG